jgi:hypothetical protein
MSTPRWHLLAPAASLVAAMVVASCTATGPAPGQGGSTTSSGSGGQGGDGLLYDAGLGDGGDACGEAAKLIYVLSQEKGLYSFYPATLAFQKIGALACPATPGASPFSMAVDRAGVAWVLYDDGSLFHVSTADASCTTTSFVAGNPSFAKFGMGFVADAPGSSAETLYVSSFDGTKLGKIDTGTLALSVVGAYDAVFQSAELTGTGDARLYGFFTTAPPIVAEIDALTGHVLSQAPQPSVDIGSAWAFAFWGGDFWLFTAPGVASRVDRYRPSDGSTVTMKSNVGFNIVGAGVSTCAPLTTPG